MQIELSDHGQRLNEPSAVNELTAQYASDFRKGIDINLGVGYVNDETIPHKAIVRAVRRISRNPQLIKSAFNYGGAIGCPNLIEAIKKYYLKNQIGKLNHANFEQIKTIIGANGATSLLDAFSDVVKPGLVITADPYYYIYTDSLQRKGYTILPIPEDDEGIAITLLKNQLEKIDPENISFFYIVTVNNPTGTITSNKRKKEIVQLAHELSAKRGSKIPLIFDKAYEDIIHNKAIEKPVSGLKYDDDGLVFEIGTLSKLLAPALRIGYMLGHDHSIMDLIVQRTSDIGFSAPLMNQEIAAILLNKFVNKHKRKVNNAYRKKAAFLQDRINKKLKNYLLELRGGDAGFYFYLTLKNIETGKGSDFYKYLTRTTENPRIDGRRAKKPRLVYIPGEICSKQENAHYQFRIAYAYDSMENLNNAVSLIKKACDYASRIEGKRS